MKLAKMITTLILISLLVRPASALAQEINTPASDPWAAVKSLPMGSELVVRLTSDKKVKGSLITATDAELRVSLGKSISMVSRDSIRKVYQVVVREEGGKAEMIGTAAGLGTGVALAVEGSEGSPSALGVVLAALLIGALGYAVGRGFSSKQKQLLIYEKKK